MGSDVAGAAVGAAVSIGAAVSTAAGAQADKTIAQITITLNTKNIFLNIFSPHIFLTYRFFETGRNPKITSF